MAYNSQRPNQLTNTRSNVRQPLLYEDHGISKDRQKFLIICVFDFAFSTLLWLLSTVIYYMIGLYYILLKCTMFIGNKRR